MHSPSTVAEVLALRDAGLGARRIAKRTNLSVGTVKDWLAGRLPSHSRGVDPSVPAPAACQVCGHPEHSFDGLPGEYVYLLGLYLGDGSLASHPRAVYRLRITLDVRYPGIIHSAAAAIAAVRQRNALVQRRLHQNCVDVSSYWKAWPCLLPQHGPGKKHERTIRLVDWQRMLVNHWPELLLRGLIHSDGHRFLNTGRGGWSWPRYGFTNKSTDICDIFSDACDQIGVRWTVSRSNGKTTIYVSRKADVAKLDAFIGPKC